MCDCSPDPIIVKTLLPCLAIALHMEFPSSLTETLTLLINKEFGKQNILMFKAGRDISWKSCQQSIFFCIHHYALHFVGLLHTVSNENLLKYEYSTRLWVNICSHSCRENNRTVGLKTGGCLINYSSCCWALHINWITFYNAMRFPQ